MTKNADLVAHDIVRLTETSTAEYRIVTLQRQDYEEAQIATLQQTSGVGASRGKTVTGRKVNDLVFVRKGTPPTGRGHVTLVIQAPNMIELEEYAEHVARELRKGMTSGGEYGDTGLSWEVRS